MIFVLFVQFKEHDKHPWGSVLSVEACNFTKSSSLPWCFSRSLNCTNSTKSCKASHIETGLPNDGVLNYTHIY